VHNKHRHNKLLPRVGATNRGHTNAYDYAVIASIRSSVVGTAASLGLGFVFVSSVLCPSHSIVLKLFHAFIEGVVPVVSPWLSKGTARFIAFWS